MPEPELLGYKQTTQNGSVGGDGEKNLPPVETDSEGEDIKDSQNTRPSTADPDKAIVKFSKDKDDEKKEGKDDKDKKDDEPEKMVGFCEVLKFADCVDVVLMVVGSLCAIAHGAALPAMIIVFGDMTDLFVNSGKLMYFLDTIASYLSANSISRSSVISDPSILNSQQANISAYYPNTTFDFTVLQNSAQQNLLDTMTTFAIYYVGIGCGVFVMGYGQVVCWVTAAERQAHKIRVSFFQNVMRQEIGWFDTHESGELNTRLADDINKIHAGIGDKMGSFMQWFAGFVAGFAIGFVYGWKLTLVITAISPLLAITGFIMNKLVSTMSTKELDAYAKAGAVAEEVLGAIRTVMAFGGQDKECARYNKNLNDAKAFGIKKGLTNGVTMGTIWLVMFGAYALGFWYGAKLIREENDVYSAGKTLIVFFSVLIGAFSLGNAAPNIQSLATARGAAFMIFAIIDQDPSIDSSSDKGEKPDRVIGNVKFKNIKFTYPARTEVQVLKGVTLDVNCGETVALVGSSGCGKSTMVQLMQRFYDPQEGEIDLDGRDLKSLNVKWLRRHIGIVSQEPVLFATTISENIRYGRPDVSQTEIEAAAKMANAHDFIMKLPEKYETLVGERGAQLSGGQKQRVAIARAMVRDPKILLLDEATSALDTESEAVVQEALDKARTGRTTIVIAHRLSTIKTADKIAGFKDGLIVEKGTHNELMKKGGVYATLVNMQTRDIDEEEEELIAEFTGKKPQQKASKKKLEHATSITSDVVEAKTSMTDKKSKKDKKKKKKDEDEVPDAPLKRILRTNAPEWPYIVGGCFVSIINGGVQPAFAVIFAEILGVFSLTDENEQEKEINKYVLVLVGLGAGSFFSFLGQGYFFGVSGENLTMRLRQLVFRAMLQQDITWFDDHKNTTGALTTRLATDASQVQGAAGAKIGTFVQNIANMGTALVIAFIYGWKLTLVILAFLPIIAVAGALEMKVLTGIAGARLGTIIQSIANIGTAFVIAFVYGWKLTLVVLAFLPILGIAGYLQMKVLTGIAGANKEALEDAGKIATEGIENIRTVAGLTMEKRILALYKEALIAPYKAALKKAHITAIAFSVSQGVLFFAYAASFWFGAYLIQQDEMNYTDVFKVFSAIVFGAMALGQASAFAPDASKAQVSAGHIYHLLDQKPTIDAYSTEGEQPSASDFTSSVKFNDCHFCYPTRPDVEVLQGLTFGVDPGETIALVGASGCGKSTSVQLIERFYDVKKGEVMLDKYDIRSLNIQWLRKQIGLVSQEPILFDCSIAENIAYGDNFREVSMDEIIAAARSANIHEFISTLPNGYDTNVGEKGTQLSGGQKQRVAIARALVRNPKILLLDEATSALDTESEKVVQDALDKARAGRTCVVIAHRLSTIQNADKICVIKHGQVAEQGRHSELMPLQGIYYRLITTAQSRGK